jgi:hypothetical protein
MQRLNTFCLIVLLAGLLSAPAGAAPFLFEWALNIDGAVFTPGDFLPGTVNSSAFDFVTGLGTLSASLGPGNHNVIFYADIEIDETVNTFYNEFGDTSGLAPVGLSWEIDEPGFNPPYGDIYTNMLNGLLDNTNAVSANAVNDVSFAVGWSLFVPAGFRGFVSWNISETAPSAGFYLTQVDPDSPYTLYFNGDVTVRPEGVVPEPGTWPLVLAGIALVAARFRASRKK